MGAPSRPPDACFQTRTGGATAVHPAGTVATASPWCATTLTPHFSLLLSWSGTAAGGEPQLPVAALAALHLVRLPISQAVTSVAAAGEEVGWRGWLLPRLVDLAARWALPLSGLAWGVWHTPAILLGLNVLTTYRSALFRPVDPRLVGPPPQ